MQPTLSTSGKKPRVWRSGRGRPRTRTPDAPRTDLGTPELVLKRAFRTTSEPIDVCLERGIITMQQHRCALHLRWLHTLRYGVPSVTALDLSRSDGADLLPENDPAWRCEREQEYNDAIQLLILHRYSNTLLPCIIYNEWPRFLKREHAESCLKNPARADAALREAARFAQGLALLAQYWRINQRKKAENPRRLS